MNAQDIRNLQEAYQAVYAPQELTEERVWEEVENLVNYLIEEGYDLSDYTWEEMYESYIEEQGRPANRRTGGPSVAQVNAGIAAKDAAKAAKAAQRGPTGAAARPELQFKSTKVPSPATSTNRSQQFRDTQRLNRTTGGGLMGTTNPTNLPSRAPKPAWEKPALGPAPKPTTTKPTPTSTTKPTTKLPGANRVGQVAGVLAGLRGITPAGVAAAVSAPRPTASGTLTAALKRGDYKPQQGPKNPDQGLSKSQSFDKAYKTAKIKSGMGSTFTWNNKSYKVEGYDSPQELTEEVEIATEYFYEMGLNEYGIDILIEELGVEEFVDWVNEIAEDYTLNEARSAKRRRAGGPSYEEVKKKQEERDAAKTRKRATKAAVKNQPETEETPNQTKKGLFAAIDAGIERHNKATRDAERLAGETGKTLRKAAKAAAPFASGVASGISGAARLAGRLLRKEEYDALFSYVLDEGYADNEEAATTIVENMSEKWISTILEGHPVDDERLLMQRGRPYLQRGSLRPKPRKKSIGG